MRRALRHVAAALLVAAGLLGHAAAHSATPICGSGERVTCVVDGDTVWFEGVKYRFQEIDTPEMGGLAECPQEALQAAEATERLAEILSSNAFTIERKGEDRYGRVLARFVIGETTAGEMLIDEGLARPWKGRREDWCTGPAMVPVACVQDPEDWRPRPTDRLPPAPAFITGEFRCMKTYSPKTGICERVCSWTDG